MSWKYYKEIKFYDNMVGLTQHDAYVYQIRWM